MAVVHAASEPTSIAKLDVRDEAFSLAAMVLDEQIKSPYLAAKHFYNYHYHCQPYCPLPLPLLDGPAAGASGNNGDSSSSSDGGISDSEEEEVNVHPQGQPATARRIAKVKPGVLALSGPVTHQAMVAQLNGRTSSLRRNKLARQSEWLRS